MRSCTAAVGVLDQTRQKADEHRADWDFSNSSVSTEMAVDGGHFAQVHAAYAVGDRKEVTVRSGLVTRTRNEGSHRVFIVGANFAGITCLAKLHPTCAPPPNESSPSSWRAAESHLDSGTFRLKKPLGGFSSAPPPKKESCRHATQFLRSG